MHILLIATAPFLFHRTTARMMKASITLRVPRDERHGYIAMKAGITLRAHLTTEIARKNAMKNKERNKKRDH